LDWDENKNRENLQKHGFDFADARQLFGNPLLVSQNIRKVYREDRWIGISKMNNGTIIVLIFLKKNGITRIISMGKALKRNESIMKRVSRTNWAKIKSMKDQEIDFSDIPELTDDFFKEAVLWPGKKKQITIRLDPDILDFYKGTGKGYQSRINNVLRRYMEAFSLKEKQERYGIKKVKGVGKRLLE
jgi:uncharacterized DUF497 family protein